MSLEKHVRQESAIKRLENTLKMHEANAELTVAIMKDKGLSTGASEKVESIRKKKIERVKTTIQNTKKRMGN
jgi:FKBP-type peptidyl-prolyl cis-trans isomerase 2